jgi:hypothetical protein
MAILPGTPGGYAAVSAHTPGGISSKWARGMAATMYGIRGRASWDCPNLVGIESGTLPGVADVRVTSSLDRQRDRRRHGHVSTVRTLSANEAA